MTQSNPTDDGDTVASFAAVIVPARARSSATVAVCVCVSVILHGAVLGAVLGALASRQSSTELGGGGVERDAIGVELVSSSVFEADVTATRRAAAAADVEVETVEGARTQAGQQASREQAQNPVEPAVRPLPATAADAPPAPSVEKAAVEPAPRSTDNAGEAEQAKGGARARGIDGRDPPGAVAAASPGVVAKYRNEISAALAKTRLNGGGRRGTVTMIFAIGSTGAVGEVGISESSGDARLDALAVEALQHKTFAKPPIGMTQAQLTYLVPFYFR